MPQPLKRTNAPIDWSPRAIANHPVLSCGVGACVITFASLEALMGVFLATIRWENAQSAVDAWAEIRTVEGKLRLLHSEAHIIGSKFEGLAMRTLDQYVGLSKRRNKLAHGFFGVVADRENEFAWREGAAAANMQAKGISSWSMAPISPEPTWIYKPKDFQDLCQACSDTFDKMDHAIRLLPIIHGLGDRLPDYQTAILKNT